MKRATMTMLTALACAAAPAGIAAQEEAVHAVSAKVRSSDLDLRRAADTAVLLQRLERTATTACRMNDPVWPDRGPEFDACRARFVAEGVAKFRAPALTALHGRVAAVRQLARK